MRGGIRTHGSEGSGEETTGRKAGTGASPLTLRELWTPREQLVVKLIRHG